MADLTIEHAQPSDAAAVEKLLDAAATWQQSRGIRQWTPGSFDDEVNEAIADRSLYVARREDLIVGCFMLDLQSPPWMTPWLIEQGRVSTEAAHVGRLAVAREASGRGLGRVLLREARTLAAERGLAYLRLDCPAENGRLRRYYVEAGFSYIGDFHTRGPNGERWVSSVFEQATSAQSEREAAAATDVVDGVDAKRIVADGYNRMGRDFLAWNSSLPQEGRRWFLAEVLRRLRVGSSVLELGCGPGTDAAELAAGRRYVGIDLSPVQLAIARQRVPGATFLVADLTRINFRPASFDGVVALYAFNHVPQAEVERAFTASFEVLRPGGRLMLAALPTMEAEDRVEEWLDVPMFFAGVEPSGYERALRDVGFDVETDVIRFATQEAWGVSEPRWIIARKPPSSPAGSSRAHR
jgi:SAM-dependent methyltransferase/ribosomal protein S18 acetylase RimI-like enzyme